MAENLVTLEQVSVSAGGVLVLDQIDLSIRRGEQWLLTGASGSGKSVLAHTLAGRHFYQGRIVFHFGKEVSGEVSGEWSVVSDAGEILRGLEGRAGTAPGESLGEVAIVEQQHRFKNLPGTTELYYQQRFNSSDADQTITVEEELREYGVLEDPKAEQWLDGLHVRSLLSKPLIQLSNGENKRVQLAIALSSEPKLLILDNPFIGLDVEGRRVLHQLINGIVARGIHILLIGAAHEIPEAITHIARLEKGRLTMVCRKEDFREEGVVKGGVQLDPSILQQLRRPQEEDLPQVVKMEDVMIRYGEATILKGISWEVRKGEKWNVSGPNGAGKSTLLSLITADNPQAYANKIWLFGRKRGSGESIWDIKRRIGYVSPELHLYFDYSATCREVIASGLFDTIGLFRALSAEQEETVLLWMRLLSLEALPSRRLSDLSAGQQRMVLLARALIKNPPLLILDEPCQGLDDEKTNYFKELIDLLCGGPDTTLIYVSHYTREIPACVTSWLALEKGEGIIKRNF